jgi:hypothetical protein
MATTTSRSIHLLPDVLNGAFLGDWAPRLGVAGSVTQAVVFYLPVIGTLCAIRDLFACLHKHDSLGAILNALAIFPVLGGFPKTAEVIHNFVTINHAYRATRIATGQAKEPGVEAKIANPLAGLSLFIAAVTPLLLVVPWIFQLPGDYILIGLGAPVVAIALGHIALGRAKRHPEAHAHRGTARTALGLGYFYLIVLAMLVWLLLSTRHAVGPFGPVK